MTAAPLTSEDGVTTTSHAHALRIQRWTPRLVAFGEFIDGYDLLVMGSAILFLKPYFGLSAAQTGWLTAVAFIGTALGLVAFGDLTDRVGRRVIFMVNLVFFVAAALLCAFSSHYWELFAARFAVGVAVGMDIPTSQAFLAEIAPKRRRGRVAGSLPNMMWLSGAIASVLLALVLRDHFGTATWRIMFGAAALPAVLVLIARQFLPESPRWLMAQGRTAEAEALMASLGLEQPAREQPATGPRRSYRELFAGGAGRRLVVVTAFFALQAFGGAVATVAGPLVISSTGIGTKYSLQFSLLGFVGGLIAVSASAQLIDRMSRRMLGIACCAGVFLAALGIALAGRNHHSALLAGYLTFSVLIWFGPAVLAWVWSSEAMPTPLRGLGTGIAQAVGRLATALNVVLAPTLLAAWGLRAVVFYACAYLACVLIIALSPFLDSAGKDLEEIAVSDG